MFSRGYCETCKKTYLDKDVQTAASMRLQIHQFPASNCCNKTSSKQEEINSQLNGNSIKVVNFIEKQ